ncbi:expressed unknown protein [Seminavis robusta]|uniref:BTB domain-containing protein n=1 Tax=Seminavis robusta TaxID=568900 RepID=A0A9N8DV64_9STRA|nr:expressed unknown protein [Seminavis robusta]|eukprot:Sro300_g111670.1 n/a (375) ;mRNA; f:20685-21809
MASESSESCFYQLLDNAFASANVMEAPESDSDSEYVLDFVPPDSETNTETVEVGGIARDATLDSDSESGEVGGHARETRRDTEESEFNVPATRANADVPAPDSDSETAEEGVVAKAATRTTEEPPHKKVKTCTKLEPDVTLLVGNEEYQEYSQALCSWSKYFEDALTSGTKRFEIPDHDPKEWEMIVAITKPLAKVKLTQENVFKALPWFALLCSPQGLQECESILLSLLEDSSVCHDIVLDILEASLIFCLAESTAKSFAKVNIILASAGLMVDKAWVVQFITVVQGHQDCLDAMWDILGELVPNTLSGQQKNALIENGLLTEVVSTKMEALHFKAAIKSVISAVNKERSKPSILTALKQDIQFSPWKNQLKD